MKADIAALGKVTVKPLAALDKQLSSTAIRNEFEVLRAANSSNSALSSAITARESSGDAQKIVIGNAGLKFQTDVRALASDLAELLVG